MPTMVEVSVPADALALGSVFEDHPDARIELDRVVPIDDLLPYFWLSNGAADLDDVAAAIRAHGDTKSLTRLTDHDDVALFDITWEPNVDHAVAALREDHCGCIELIGTRDGWDLQLRFAQRENVMRFNETLTAEGVPVTLKRLNDVSVRPDAARLSPEQIEALRTAHEHGYFHVPRDCTIGDLATEAGISDSAFSERLRRGLDSLLDYTDLKSVHADY